MFENGNLTLNLRPTPTPSSSVASQNARPRPTVLATVPNSVKQCKIATVRTDFSSTPRAKAPVAWGLATPLTPRVTMKRVGLLVLSLLHLHRQTQSLNFPRRTNTILHV
jgi:hypothetical protein